MEMSIKGLTTNRNDFLSKDELNEYDYDFLNELYTMFDNDEGALFNWRTCDNLLEQLFFHKKWVSQINPKYVLETGTHKGYYSYFLKKLLPEVKIYTFGINPESKMCVDAIEKFFAEKFITFYSGDSRETLTNFENTEEINFDLAWVDGGHEYDVALSDLNNCARLGIENILIDDCDHSGVRGALEHFLRTIFSSDGSEEEYKYDVVESSTNERQITYLKINKL